VSREIRFRAWVGEMVEVKVIDWDGRTFNDRPCIMDQRNDIWFFDDYPDMLEQFTGLHDKNGVEIFENDLVKAKGHNPEVYKIEFIEGGFCGTWMGGEGYPVDINHFYDSTGCSIEVIGNIHDQKPEEGR